MAKTLTLMHHAALQFPYWELTMESDGFLTKKRHPLCTVPDAPLQRRMLSACLDIALGDTFSPDHFEIVAPLDRVEMLVNSANNQGPGFSYLVHWVRAARAGEGEVVA